MGDWYKKRFRRTLLDMHIEDWDDSFLKNYDPEHYFQMLKEAKINAPMIYVQSHVGLCYWPTKTGVMHKAFIGREDQVKRLFDLCHQDGMDVILYYSIIYNNREYERHPEWRMRDANGKGSREHGSRYGLCCPNNEEYVEFVYKQIEEFSEYFDFEGVFFDMTFWPEVCYCDSCRKRWRNEVGGEMPRKVDWKDERWRLLAKKQEQWLGEFAEKITRKAKEAKPGVTVEHQYSASMHYWRFGNNENVAKASDYIGTDLYGGIKQQSFACKTWYNLTKNQPFQYMTSRCYPRLSEHTTTKSLDQLKQCVAMTYSHHGASLLIDAIDPCGTVDDSVYELMGKIYEETIPYEPYFTRGKMAYDIGLFYNMDGKMDVESNGMDIMDHNLDQGQKGGGTMPHQEALLGACDSLTKHHIPYGVVNYWKREEIFKHPVLVLADVPLMEEEEQKYILEYIKNGGNVYMSGHSAPYILNEVLGLTWKGYTKETITYMTPTADSVLMEGYFTRKHPLVMFEKAVLTEGKVNGRVHAVLTLPYTVPNRFSDSWPTEMHEEDYITPEDDSYPFASIHSNPPGKETDIPVLVEGTYGKGKVIWSGLPIERVERYQHSDIFSNIITYLAGNTLLFGAEASETLECVMFDAPEYNQKLFGAVETRNGFRIPETRGSKFWIYSEKKPIYIHNLPDEKEIPFEYDNHKVWFSYDNIPIWMMVVIQYGDDE